MVGGQDRDQSARVPGDSPRLLPAASGGGGGDNPLLASSFELGRDNRPIEPLRSRTGSIAFRTRPSRWAVGVAQTTREWYGPRQTRTAARCARGGGLDRNTARRSSQVSYINRKPRNRGVPPALADGHDLPNRRQAELRCPSAVRPRAHPPVAALGITDCRRGPGSVDHCLPGTITEVWRPFHLEATAACYGWLAPVLPTCSLASPVTRSQTLANALRGGRSDEVFLASRRAEEEVRS
jgi:hypothetical protein